jgi:hypothetical protein
VTIVSSSTMPEEVQDPMPAYRCWVDILFSSPQQGRAGYIIYCNNARQEYDMLSTKIYSPQAEAVALLQATLAIAERGVQDSVLDRFKRIQFAVYRLFTFSGMFFMM